MVGHVSIASGFAKAILQGTVKEEELVNRRKDGKTIVQRQLKTGQDRTGTDRCSHLCAPTALQGYGIHRKIIHFPFISLSLGEGSKSVEILSQRTKEPPICLILAFLGSAISVKRVLNFKS